MLNCNPAYWISYLEVACCLVPRSVCCHNCYILKTSNGNSCSFRYEMNSHISRCIWCINTSPCIIEVDSITLLSVYQFNDIALRTAQQRWGIIWKTDTLLVHNYERFYNHRPYIANFLLLKLWTTCSIIVHTSAWIWHQWWSFTLNL